MPRESRCPNVGLVAPFLVGVCCFIVACDGKLAFESSLSGGGFAGGGGSASSAGGAGSGGSAGPAGSAGAGNTAGSPMNHGPVACNNDRDCGLPSLYCQPMTHQCVECLYNQQCPADRPACSPGTTRCQECDGFTPCPNGAYCDLQSDKCLTHCHQDSNCDPSLNQYCNSEGLCATCDGNEECSFKLGGLLCQRSTGACVQCLQGDDECGGPTPRCLLPEGRCVACVDSSDCAGPVPYCDPVLHQCSAAAH